ncbi:hypothetical protein SRABI128_02231 [Microbacterium sp. Bi128]|nr:hypothetical protein SRABI128_02231 [Microbacterium sp. Bi128]
MNAPPSPAASAPPTVSRLLPTIVEIEPTSSVENQCWTPAHTSSSRSQGNVVVAQSCTFTTSWFHCSGRKSASICPTSCVIWLTMIGTTMMMIPAKMPSTPRIVRSTAAHRGSPRRSRNDTTGSRPSERNSAVPT